MKTWRPQELKLGSLGKICDFIRRNPHVKSIKVQPATYTKLSMEMQALQRVSTSINAQGFTILKIMGVTIELH